MPIKTKRVNWKSHSTELQHIINLVTRNRDDWQATALRQRTATDIFLKDISALHGARAALISEVKKETERNDDLNDTIENLRRQIVELKCLPWHEDDAATRKILTTFGYYAFYRTGLLRVDWRSGGVVRCVWFANSIFRRMYNV